MSDRPARIGLLILGVICSVIAVLLNITAYWYGDAHLYWLIGPAQVYTGWFPGAHNYAYSPAFAEVMFVLRQQPWPTFSAMWTAIQFAALVWLLRASPPRWRLPVLVIGLPDVLIGNIHVLLAVAIVLGFRYAGAWAFVLLTKVTPAVGLLWFAVRREWRSLGIALGTTMAIALVAYLIAPNLWPRWIEVLWQNRDAASIGFPYVPVLWRLPIAALIVLWGALTDRRWAIPVAAVVAVPNFWFQSLSLLAAIGPLVEQAPAQALASNVLDRSATTAAPSS